MAKSYFKRYYSNISKKKETKANFFIDVGLPGNIDPEISKISNCYLFDLNDLEQFFTLF